MRGSGAKTKTYSVIIISDALSTSKTFSISAKLVRRAFISLVTFVLLFGFMLFHYLSITLDKQKMHTLVSENRQNNVLVNDYKQRITELQTKLSDSEIIQKKILVILGITAPDDLKWVGAGGNSNKAPMTEEAAEALQYQLPDGMRSAIAQPPANPTPQQLVENASKLKTTFEQALQFVSSQNQRNAATPSIAPVRGLISSAFGWRVNPFTQMREFHPGLDLATQLGTDVHAPADGVVLQAEHQSGGYGNTIIIDHQFGYSTRYAHLSSFNVHVGQKIKRFDVIAKTGSSGMSTSPHLHYEISYLGKPVNPFYFILDWGK